MSINSQAISAQRLSDSRISARAFLALSVQLALVLSVAVWFRIELERGFATIAAVTLLGFVIHSWLPYPARAPFFLLLTAIAMVILLRGDALWLILIGLVLLGLCHIPGPWIVKLIAISAAGVALAAVRLGWLGLPWASTVIPVLAAMFMFRIVLYVYDLKTEKSVASVWHRLAYFFLFPNVCFPLFPVVDYSNFLRSYYDSPAVHIYQKGLYWILRGVTHLLLYRVIYYLIPRMDASDLGVLSVFGFMAMTYGLYLRVSGLFHMITGILCLFGYNLRLRPLALQSGQTG